MTSDQDIRESLAQQREILSLRKENAELRMAEFRARTAVTSLLDICARYRKAIHSTGAYPSEEESAIVAAIRKEMSL